MTLYLVTGGAGFIGSNLARTLVAKGARVRVFDSLATGSRENLASIGGEFEFFQGDIRSLDDCRAATDGATWVLHQAALPSVPRSVADPDTTHAVNATGTLNLLVAARDAGVRRLVYASSSSVYGPVPKLPREEADRPNPISPYAVSKLAGEHYCGAFTATYGLETVSLRYFNVFGPGQAADHAYAAVIPKFVRALHRGEQPEIFGDGEQGRDFTFIDNVVQANLKALEAPRAVGRAYNVGAGGRTTVNELFRMVRTVMGVDAVAAYRAPRAGDVRDSLADIRAAADDFGYDPLVTIEEGLPATVAWLRTSLDRA